MFFNFVECFIYCMFVEALFIVSMLQVKEVGIYLIGCPNIAKEVEVYFENLWKLGSLNSSDYTRTVVDQQWQVNRTVPCWSHFIERKERCRYIGGFLCVLLILFTVANAHCLVPILDCV